MRYLVEENQRRKKKIAVAAEEEEVEEDPAGKIEKFFRQKLLKIVSQQKC